MTAYATPLRKSRSSVALSSVSSSVPITMSVRMIASNQRCCTAQMHHLRERRSAVRERPAHCSLIDGEALCPNEYRSPRSALTLSAIACCRSFSAAIRDARSAEADCVRFPPSCSRSRYSKSYRLRGGGASRSSSSSSKTTLLPIACSALTMDARGSPILGGCHLRDGLLAGTDISSAIGSSEPTSRELRSLIDERRSRIERIVTRASCCRHLFCSASAASTSVIVTTGSGSGSGSGFGFGAAFRFAPPGVPPPGVPPPGVPVPPSALLPPSGVPGGVPTVTIAVELLPSSPHGDGAPWLLSRTPPPPPSLLPARLRRAPSLRIDPHLPTRCEPRGGGAEPPVATLPQLVAFGGVEPHAQLVDASAAPRSSADLNRDLRRLRTLLLSCEPRSTILLITSDGRRFALALVSSFSLRTSFSVVTKHARMIARYMLMSTYRPTTKKRT